MLWKNIDIEKKRLFENFVSLSVLQAANYILPLITLPYLLRVIGPAKYGIIVFAQSFMQYFMFFTDYGFNLTATRDISKKRDDIQFISKLFSTIIFIKVAFFFLGFMVFALLVFSIDIFRKEYIVYISFYGMVLGNVLFPLWFYQGIEKMKYITLLNIVSKLIFTVSVFVVVRYSSDYIYVPFLYSLGSIVAGAIAIRVAIKNFGIVIKMPDKQYVIEQLKEGFHIFLSQVSVNFYKINNVFILGLFVEESIVGCFAIAKKLIDLTNQLAAVISHTVYPFINLKIEKSYNYIISFLKKLRAVIFVFTLIMGIVFLIFPDIIIHIVVGKPSSEAILCLRAMAFVPLIIGINVPAVQIILSYGKDRVYSLIVITGAVLNLALNLGLIPLFSYYGSCFAVIAAETFVTMSLYYAVYKMNLDKQPIQGATGVLPGSDAG